MTAFAIPTVLPTPRLAIRSPHQPRSPSPAAPECSPLRRVSLPPLAMAPAPDKDATVTPSPSDPDGASSATPFPQLYEAWFGPGHELATQMRTSVTAAVSSGARALELQWPVVPNLEEISAGTLLNFEFGKMVAEEFGMASAADYSLIRRYLASFCNLYWVKQVAAAEPFRNRTVWALSSDSVSKARAVDRLGNVRVGSLRKPPETSPGDVVVIIDPRYNESWQKGMRLRPEDGFVVFLNSQFNESYGLTGPRRGSLSETVPVYFLKRVTRGYAFRAFPGPWRACLEKPDLSVEELKTFDKEPKLRDIAAIVRGESNNRYGGFFNDRYVRGFGGRL